MKWFSIKEWQENKGVQFNAEPAIFSRGKEPISLYD